MDLRFLFLQEVQHLRNESEQKLGSMDQKTADDLPKNYKLRVVLSTDSVVTAGAVTRRSSSKANRVKNAKPGDVVERIRNHQSDRSPSTRDS